MSKEYKDFDDIRDWNGERILPRRVTIETIFGCNASCRMCPINLPTSRKKGVMPLELFYKIIDEFEPYRDHLNMMDLFGLGEPLLDPYIIERIRYVKNKGFKNLAISTNADLLTFEKQDALLEADIDTILISIDGTTKEIHEGIRRGVKFERVVENVQSLIRKRDASRFLTRFVIRFIKQKDNQHQLDDFIKFWELKLSKDKRDFVAVYNLHSWGGEMCSKKDILGATPYDKAIEESPCHHMFYTMNILADGTVPLCSEDVVRVIHNSGNVKEQFCLDVFNSKEFLDVRRLHVQGNKRTIEPCKECTVLYSEVSRKVNS